MTATFALLLDRALVAFGLAFLLTAAVLLATRRQPRGPAFGTCLGVLSAGLAASLWLSEWADAGAAWRGTHLAVLVGLLVALAEFGRRGLRRNGRRVPALWVHAPLVAGLAMLAGLGWRAAETSAAGSQPAGAMAVRGTGGAEGGQQPAVGLRPSAPETETWNDLTAQRLQSGFLVLCGVVAIVVVMAAAAAISERRCGRRRKPAF